MLNKKLSLITLFSTVTLMSIFSIGRTPISPLNAEGEIPTPLNTISISLDQSLDIISTSTSSILLRSPRLYVDNIIAPSRQFDFNLNSRLNQSTGSYLLLPGYDYSSGNFGEDHQDALYIINESGSSANKYKLTKLTINGSRRIGTSNTTMFSSQVTSPTLVSISLDKITSAIQANEEEEIIGSLTTSTTHSVGTFTSTTASSLSDTDLNNAAFTPIIKTFDYEDDAITKFRLRSTHPFFFSSIVFEYSIDYSSC
jgi:hypothetical protein